MVQLTKIYTRSGDDGNTRLADMSKTSKTDPRVKAYGAVDEANSLLGIISIQPDLDAQIATILRHIQNELFDLGADLATPLTQNPKTPPLRIDTAAITRLEGWCDDFSAVLPTMRSFVLPGGTPSAAFLQLARCVVRRAEREAWEAAEAYGIDTPGGVNLLAMQYLNRLSDLLFIFARVTTAKLGEILWVPGGERTPPDAKSAKQRQQIANQQAAAD